MVILENIDIDIDIDKAILQNIDKISNRFKFGISNRANTMRCSQILQPGVIIQSLTKILRPCQSRHKHNIIDLPPLFEVLIGHILSLKEL